MQQRFLSPGWNLFFIFILSMVLFIQCFVWKKKKLRILNYSLESKLKLNQGKSFFLPTESAKKQIIFCLILIFKWQFSVEFTFIKAVPRLLLIRECLNFKKMLHFTEVFKRLDQLNFIRLIIYPDLQNLVIFLPSSL